MKKYLYIILMIIIMMLLFCGLEKNNKINNFNEVDIISNKIMDINVINSGNNIEENNMAHYVNLIEKNSIKETNEQKEILNAEVEKRNIILENNQENQIDVIINKELSTIEKEKVEEMGFSEDEFKDNLKKELILMQKRVKLKEKLISEINSNNISIDNVEFKNKVDKYNKNKETDERSAQECLNLLNEYIKLLQDNTIIENN